MQSIVLYNSELGTYSIEQREPGHVPVCFASLAAAECLLRCLLRLFVLTQPSLVTAPGMHSLVGWANQSLEFQWQFCPWYCAALLLQAAAVATAAAAGHRLPLLLLLLLPRAVPLLLLPLLLLPLLLL
jgi:hypothetical protein